MKLLLTGGGTMGSVSPLLAIVQEFKKQGETLDLLWLGTKNGPERKIIEERGIKFQFIFTGRFRRYFSWRNLIAPCLIILGFFQSIFIILKFRPNLILSAGSFVSVPVVWAGWLLGIPSLIHQQDIIPGLANKLMAPFAKKITVSFEKSLNDFAKSKTILTGNPVREEIFKGDKKLAEQIFNLEPGLPTILVLGGGTGAQFINQTICQIIQELTQFCQIIHLTGKNKFQVSSFKFQVSKRYHQYEFLTNEMADVYVVADVVIGRAGMGTITELSALAKPAILIPIPDSHQEANARYFADKKAAVVFTQKKLTPEILLKRIKEILTDQSLLTKLGGNLYQFYQKEATQRIIQEIRRLTEY